MKRIIFGSIVTVAAVLTVSECTSDYSDGFGPALCKRPHTKV
ncbi:MAG: hypothetical protein WDN30_14390 [Pararobbsia sp.]